MVRRHLPSASPSPEYASPKRCYTRRVLPEEADAHPPTAHGETSNIKTNYGKIIMYDGPFSMGSPIYCGDGWSLGPDGIYLSHLEDLGHGKGSMCSAARSMH